ncbi:hypothetical protein N7532_005102 [Penicillium argentinense]|uniref:Uncharacterized protein n=1 Tax=Penicillium argentinense TaxID=1131581 RepID=A0A9W9KA15_9EURO|nr:uncharacterized protein N7532_005102 [Penicillium argentinense]KAJ5098101.1 hypothetical protein N7532_005102 [Penicillium argentinense]
MNKNSHFVDRPHGPRSQRKNGPAFNPNRQTRGPGPSNNPRRNGHVRSQHQDCSQHNHQVTQFSSVQDGYSTYSGNEARPHEPPIPHQQYSGQENGDQNRRFNPNWQRSSRQRGQNYQSRNSTRPGPGRVHNHFRQNNKGRLSQQQLEYAIQQHSGYQACTDQQVHIQPQYPVQSQPNWYQEMDVEMSDAPPLDEEICISYPVSHYHSTIIATNENLKLNMTYRRPIHLSTIPRRHAKSTWVTPYNPLFDSSSPNQHRDR